MCSNGECPFDVFIPAQYMAESCNGMASTATSITFDWESAPSATRYVVSNGTANLTTTYSNITLQSLIPGKYYTYMVWAVLPGDPAELTTNSITCRNTTGKLFPT